ncbi:4Fe-4S dicluster domain-containing protein [Plebeiibacterium sediminum]|uniref:4Fe-4S dicluster domain-containing protein n=1 Tax=Plebeiibacterium sediminum TaxID=2992112 RepID=A0AAE3M9U4_9BACT|nr:4Fe-4S dicluster domain-containing protein [Plebeiobacterium sediminum]MCW3789459.1 4Fe-4S dicluster domain-containing protein [Plebeiobacterium sediminum]
MNNLDFLKPKSRQIDFDKFDNRILDYVLEREESFLTCMSCGGCTATCSAGNLTSFNIRKIGLSLRRGNVKDLSEEIEKCMFCGKCTLVCPRDINIRNVVLLIKKRIAQLKSDNAL